MEEDMFVVIREGEIQVVENPNDDDLWVGNEMEEVGVGEEARKEPEMEDDMLVVIREGEMQVVENPNDDDLAEAVQMQELLFFFLQPEEVTEVPPPGTGTVAVATITVPTDEEPIDPKGKQAVEFTLTYSVAEPGECSKVVHDMFYCPICMEGVKMQDGFNIKPCDHIFCISCMIHYITVKTEENATSIPCPTLGCGTTSIDPVTCQHFLTKDTFDRWCLTLCELSLGLKKFYCPFKDCSALLIDEGAEMITNSECPHCNRMFCVKCNVPWHGNMSCEEFEGLGEGEKERDDLLLRNLANDKRWQRCPDCRMYVEKIDGCMFMKCRCGYCFCYACASPMSNETHYCGKCMR